MSAAPVRTPISPAQMVLAGAPTLYGPDGRPLDLSSGLAGPDSWFGPGRPIPPRIREDGFPPREFDYPPSWNLNWTPRGEGIGPSFVQLRSMAVLCVQARLAIRYRKEQLRGARIEFVPRDKGAVTPSQRARYQGSIDAATAFWERPNRIDANVPWSVWLAQVVEEILVTDALTIFRAPDKAGRLHSLVQVNGACYSADTEVLTRSGWKPFSEVSVGVDGDEFATRNPATKAFEWQKSTYFHRQNYSGTMYRFHSRSLDILVSPNHRMLVETRPRAARKAEPHGSDWIVTAEDLAESATHNTFIPSTSEWHCTAMAQVSFDGDTPRRAALPGRKGWKRIGAKPRPFLMSGEDFARFMGMYLAEGCVTATGTPKRDAIYISQLPKSKGFEPYRALLRKLLGRECGHNGSAFHFKAQAFSDYLRQFGQAREKFVPDCIKDMPPAQLREFWHYFMLGDGFRDGAREGVTTSSKRMAGDLQEIAQKLGMSASISVRYPKDITIQGRVVHAKNCVPNYVLRLRKSRRQTFAVSKQEYTGDIFCVSVPNETLYVRRNGKPAWCCNTIKPLIDQFGHVYAYQQVVKGQPNTEYSADRLMYLPYNGRVDNVYGTSPLEELIPIVNRAILRAARDNAYYTDGQLPAGFITAPDEWSPEQIAAMQAFIDDYWTGDTMRSRVRIVPGGSGYVQAKPFEFSAEEEAAIDRKIMAGYGVPPSALVAQVNRATAEKSHEESLDNGLRPLQMFLKWIVDTVTQNDLGLSDVEMVWPSEFAGAGAEEAQADATLVSAGIITVDEARAKRGMEPFASTEDGEGAATGVAGDVQTTALNGAQVTALQAIVQSVVAGQLPPDSAVAMILVAFPSISEETARAMVSPAAKAEPPTAAPAPKPLPEPPKPADEKPPEEEAPAKAAAAQELAQWHRFATKPERVKRGRWCDPFVTRALPQAIADGLRFALGMATSEEAVREVFRVAKTRLQEAA